MISALTAAAAAAAANELAINEAGTSKKVTAAQLKTFVNNAPVFAAGSASANTKPKLTSGTLLTTPEAGAIEYDGTALYGTVDATNGRTQFANQQIFRLTANGAAIGAGIADYFGANSALPTVTNAIYELNFYMWFLKTTGGTVTWTITNTQTYTNIVAYYFGSAVAGITPEAAARGSGIVTTTAAAAALPASGTLTTAVNHHHRITAIAECATAGDIRLRATESAGTITPLRGSYYTARRLFAGNVGIFAA
jgi:hypothetical protein